MADYGVSDTSTTSLGTNQFPISEAWVPGVALTAVEGMGVNTDGGGKKSTAIRMGLKDGDSVTEGAKADTAITDSTTTNSKMSFLKGLVKIWADIWDSVNHRVRVDGSGVTQPVSGTFWQATQPVSNASLPLPTGAALEAGGNLAAILTALNALVTDNADLLADGDNLANILTQVTNHAVAQSGTWTVQPGNTANTTAWKVDNSAVTQPASLTTGAAIALSSPPSTTNAGSDTLLTFASQVKHWLVQNNSSANVYIALDATASTSSIVLVPGATWREDIPVTVIHAYTAAAQNVNGVSGIIVEGWL